ncbi:MAG: thiamine-phosphate kinase [Candidatus Competibacterales bacterium]|nr:thiamine-phosphate kinase [Candidatus Competibacterales bacterium]
MSLSEFDLIEHCFTCQAVSRDDVVLGVGDDCALLQPPPGQQLAVSLDVLVAGRHFHADAEPERVGHKALAVNLSDLAAMGARPAWATLGLTLPAIDPDWVDGFRRGFLDLAARHGLQLIGGDTTRGPLAIAVQVHGFVDPGRALRRDGARPGDRVWMTGTLGDAALGLDCLEGRRTAAATHRDYLRGRLERPTPRVSQGLALVGLASAAIDLSDGLAQDLGHILARSGVGARLALERLPVSPALAATLDGDDRYRVQLSGGDDYELCFTVPPARLAELRARSAAWDCAATEIGVIEPAPGLRCLRADGTRLDLERGGYDHFA